MIRFLLSHDDQIAMRTLAAKHMHAAFRTARRIGHLLPGGAVKPRNHAPPVRGHATDQHAVVASAR